MIYFFNEDVSMPEIDIERIEYWVNSLISESNKIVGDINYIFCSDEFLLEINKKYLHHDYFTDIITFNYNEANVISSDIFISIDRVKDNSITYSTNYHEELLRVIIHGILHLMGFNDKGTEQEQAMRRLEDDCIKKY